MTAHVDVMDLVSRLKAAEEAFVLATVVRTVSVTAAKAGAKAVIRPDGTIAAGWIGGGCAKGAVLKAAREALADGESRLVSIQPENLLAELGVKPGESRLGVKFAKNMCPSQGTMDIFVEPVLPHPSLVILGASPVAMALAEQARPLGYHVTVAVPAGDMPAAPDADVADRRLRARPPSRCPALHRRFHAGQGRRGRAQGGAGRRGRRIGLSSAAAARWRRCAQKLLSEGVEAAALDSVKAPAGLDLGAITPEEIALSILAEITVERRRGQRGEGTSLP